MVSVALVVKVVAREETKDEFAAFLSGAAAMASAEAGRPACVTRRASRGMHRVEHAS